MSLESKSRFVTGIAATFSLVHLGAHTKGTNKEWNGNGNGNGIESG